MSVCNTLGKKDVTLLFQKSVLVSVLACALSFYFHTMGQREQDFTPWCVLHVWQN